MPAFALALAAPCPPEQPDPYTYDEARQLNILSDGRPAVRDRITMAACPATESTAGSRKSKDDTEPDYL